MCTGMGVNCVYELCVFGTALWDAYAIRRDMEHVWCALCVCSLWVAWVMLLQGVWCLCMFMVSLYTGHGGYSCVHNVVWYVRQSMLCVSTVVLCVCT